MKFENFQIISFFNLIKFYVIYTNNKVCSYFGNLNFISLLKFFLIKLANKNFTITTNILFFNLLITSRESH